MKKFLLPSLLLMTCVYTAAQKSPIKFGQVSMDELQMKAYAPDSSAAAVILCDYGEAYVSIGNTATLNFERHVRIKIFKKEGLSWADAAISLYSSGGNEERVLSLKAASYNLENGKVVETKMSKDNVFKENFNRNLKLHKFTIPNAKEGSVIEYSYTVASDFLDRFPNWRFQYSIPVKRSEYWAILPDFFVFEKYMQGYIVVDNYEIKPITSASHQSKGHHWILEDVPAFREEPYMTSEEDYVSKVNFALSHINIPGEPIREIMGSWAKLNNDLMNSEAFGKAITGSNFLKKTVDEITAGKTEPLDKIQAIYNYVRATLEWDGTKDYYADPLKKVFELKKGTSGDINIALASMLEKAGINVNMVMLSTRDHGFIRKEYPMRKQFNYVIVAASVGDKIYFLDATEKYLPINVIPERCLNGQGMVVSASNPVWIDLQTKTKARTVVTADLTVNPEGEVTGKLQYTRDGYDASRMRKQYFSQGEGPYVQSITAGKPWRLESSEFLDLQDIGKPTRENYGLTIQEHASVAGDAIYLNPFVTAQLEENPFRLEKREYPVDFGSPLERVYVCKITVPEGYAVDEVPQSKMFVLPGNAAKYLYNVAVSGKSINITSSMHINKNMFVQTEYANLREFYNQVVAKQSEQIVLKKQ